MNNDIWSVRREPLIRTDFVWLKTLPECNSPDEGTRMLFVNNRLKRAWVIIVEQVFSYGFAAQIMSELDYKDAIQNAEVSA